MWPLTLINICLLRANPQDLPVSTSLTVFALMVYYAADVATAAANVPSLNAFQAAAVDTFLLIALVHGVLNYRGFQIRARQTLIALAGTGALLSLLTLAVAALLPDDVPSAYPWLLSVAWLFAVYGWVLRHAFGVSYLSGVMAAGTYFFVSLLATAPFLVMPQT